MTTTERAGRADGAGRARQWAALVMVAATVMVPAVGCASSRDLGSSETKTTIRDLGEDLIVDEDDLVAGGSEGERKLQRVIDQLVASNDPCAILTQKGIQANAIDPTTLASSRARRTLARGVIEVYDHLIEIVPDKSLTPSLVVQRDTFVEVLNVVERYTANPNSKQGNEQIATLVKGEDFVRAASAVSTWTFTNCG